MQTNIHIMDVLFHSTQYTLSFIFIYALVTARRKLMRCVRFSSMKVVCKQLSSDN